MVLGAPVPASSLTVHALSPCPPRCPRPVPTSSSLAPAQCPQPHLSQPHPGAHHRGLGRSRPRPSVVPPHCPAVMSTHQSVPQPPSQALHSPSLPSAPACYLSDSAPDTGGDSNASTLAPWTLKLRLLMPPAGVSRPLWTWGAWDGPSAVCWWRWVLLPPALSGGRGLTRSGLCLGTKLIVGPHRLQVCGKQMR